MIKIEQLLSLILALSFSFTSVVTLASEGEMTRVYMVGTGTPVPESSRAGASVAIVYNGKTFLFDAGATVSNRLEILAENGEKRLFPHKLQNVFLTHIHSDHTLGLPAIMLSLWWLRDQPITYSRRR